VYDFFIILLRKIKQVLDYIYSTFGYCLTGIRTLSDSFMFLLLITSRYFLSSSSFLPSEPWNFSISEK